jgi:hypothetical protein
MDDFLSLTHNTHTLSLVAARAHGRNKDYIDQFACYIYEPSHSTIVFLFLSLSLCVCRSFFSLLVLFLFLFSQPGCICPLSTTYAYTLRSYLLSQRHKTICAREKKRKELRNIYTYKHVLVFCLPKRNGLDVR